MANEPQSALPKYCGSCGKELLQGADFCAYCGAPVPKLGTQSHPQTTISPYYVTPRAPMTRTEPPLPFIKHFQGVILTPHTEMPRIMERPNYKQPIVLNILVGILTGVALAVILSKVTMTFTTEFRQSLVEMFGTDASNMDMESLILFSFFFSSLFGPFLLWLVNSLILYFLLVVFAPTVSSTQRNFKTSATIIGWTSVPQIVGEIFNVFYNLIFIPESTFEFNELGDIQNLTLTTVSGPIEWVSLALNFAILIWGVLLVYWAVKSIFPQGNQPVIIAIAYIVVRIVVSFVLTGFLI
jgi:hypothetical protein